VELLDYVVRHNWRELTWEMHRGTLRLWRRLFGLVILSSLVLLPLGLLAPPDSVWDVLRTVTTSCAFIVFPLYGVGWLRRDVPRRFAVGLGTIIGAAALGRLARPQAGAAPRPTVLTIGLLGSLAMLAPWIVLFQASHQEPRALQDLGVTAENWLPNVLIGGLIGAALAAHLALTREFVGLSNWWRPSWILLLWHLCFSVGLQGLGEELLFRGLGYRLLHEQLGRGLGHTMGVLTLLSLLPRLTLRSVSLSSSFDAWILVYLIGISAINIALRAWRDSLVPGIACQAVLSVLTLLLTGRSF
jgi:hypothetical protein